MGHNTHTQFLGTSLGKITIPHVVSSKKRHSIASGQQTGDNKLENCKFVISTKKTPLDMMIYNLQFTNDLHFYLLYARQCFICRDDV